MQQCLRPQLGLGKASRSRLHTPCDMAQRMRYLRRRCVVLGQLAAVTKVKEWPVKTLAKAWAHYAPFANRLLEDEHRLHRRLDVGQRFEMEYALTCACVFQWMDGWDSGLEGLRLAADSHEEARRLIRRARARVARYTFSSTLLDMVLDILPDPAVLAPVPKRGRGRPRKDWLKLLEPALRDLGATQEEARFLLSEVARAVAEDPNRPTQPVPR